MKLFALLFVFSLTMQPVAMGVASMVNVKDCCSKDKSCSDENSKGCCSRNMQNSDCCCCMTLFVEEGVKISFVSHSYEMRFVTDGGSLPRIAFSAWHPPKV